MKFKSVGDEIFALLKTEIVDAGKDFSGDLAEASQLAAEVAEGLAAKAVHGEDIADEVLGLKGVILDLASASQAISVRRVSDIMEQVFVKVGTAIATQLLL